MERFSENRDKEFNRLAVPKTKKRANRWTLMLVGDRGRVISIKRFKGLAVTSALLFFIVTALAAGLYFLYNRKVDENKLLQNSLEDTRSKVKFLQGEKEQLMVSLVLAESKIKAGPAEATTEPMEEVSEASPPISAPATTPPQAGEDKYVPETTKTTAVQEPVSVSAAAVPAADISVASLRDAELQVVQIEELTVLNESENRRFQIKFKLRKTDPDIETLSGRAFVVLKQDADNQKKWITIPSVTLDAGKPSSFRRGQFFSINRFKVMTFKGRYWSDPNRFQHIAIFVYDEEGKLLFERETPIIIQEMSTAPT
jgi:hypothetical protein